MNQLNPNPQVAGLSPEQTAAMMKMDREMKVLLPQLIRIFNSSSYSINGVLGSLSVMAASVIKNAPEGHRANLYQSFQFVLRDTLFGVESIAMPLAPMVDGLKL
jgi:hypothetical protein